MTNYERLLDLPLREIISEIKSNTLIDERKAVANFVSHLITCSPDVPQCCSCYKDITKGCISSCMYWLDTKSDPDANYNEDVWHDATNEDPPTSDVTIEYIVLIDGAELPTILVFDGEHWLDSYANHYKVKYWRPMPKLPEEYNA